LSDPHFQNINPETISSYQLVYEQGIGQYLRSSLTGFYNQMNDLIIFENGNYGNINADSKGVELALEGTWGSGIKGRASYTLQHARDETGSAALPDSPDQLLKFDVSVPIINEKVFASLEFQFTSRRSTFSTAASGQTIPGMDVGAYNVVNFTLYSQNIVKNLEISASIYNLLDQQYSDPATPFHLESQIPQNGRTFWVKLIYHF
jgi:outer membrane receptor for ferrienterochelin and colicins